MLGQTSQIFVEAEMAYRRERVMADFGPWRRRPQLRWPTRVGGGRRRQPRAIMPAPHHAISH
jgi:hypothetical protein